MSKRVLLLVGVYRADWADPKFNGSVVPVVAGCIDESVWELETQEDTEKRWAEYRAAFDPSGCDYDWREVWVRPDVKGLRAPFELPEVAVEIEAPQMARDNSTGAPDA